MSDVYLHPFLKRGGWQTYFTHSLSYSVSPIVTSEISTADQGVTAFKPVDHHSNVRREAVTLASPFYAYHRFALAIGNTLTAYFSRHGRNNVRICVMERDPAWTPALLATHEDPACTITRSPTYRNLPWRERCQPLPQSSPEHLIFEAFLTRYSYSPQREFELACLRFGNDVALFTAPGSTTPGSSDYISYQVVDTPVGANTSLLFNRVDLDEANARTTLDRPFTNELEIVHYEVSEHTSRTLHIYQCDETMILEGLWALVLFEANTYLSTFYESPVHAEGIREISVPLPGVSRTSEEGMPGVRIFGDFHGEYCRALYASYYSRKDLTTPPYQPEGHWGELVPIIDHTHWFSPDEPA